MPTGKIYIGKTVDSLEVRWKNHCKQASYNKPGKMTYLLRAIRKYGHENFTLEVLEEFELEKDALDAEIKWISELNTTDPKIGMNLTDGGEGTSGRKLPEWHIQKLRDVHTGKPKSAEHRKKIGDAHRGEKSPMWGKKLSDKQKKLISEANKNKVVSQETRQKMREATLNRFKDKPMPEETREKIRQSRLGKPSEWGPNHHAARLNEKKVLEIREKYSSGKFSYTMLSSEYGVSPGTIGKIIKRQRWKHI